MRTVHNEHDLRLLSDLVEALDQAMEWRPPEATDPTSILREVRSYVDAARANQTEVVRCDGISDLPFPPAMRATIPDDKPSRVRVLTDGGNVELNFCSIWCMMGHFMRKEGMELLPRENRLDCVN